MREGKKCISNNMKKVSTIYGTSNLYKELNKRKSILEKIVLDKENALIDVPAGSIRSAMSNYDKRVRYYLRKDPTDKNGEYITKDKFELVPKLLQKKYDSKILASAKEELKDIDKFLKKYDHDRLEEIYSDMLQADKELVMPVVYDDETYVKRWISKDYVGKGFRDDDQSEFYTKKGERVRSKSEILIANALYDAGIPYMYECPISLEDGRYVYPDFKTLNISKRKTIYWEHLGLMDDNEYVNNNIKKIKFYENNDIILGDNLILTFETSTQPISPKTIQNTIKEYLI